MGWRGRLWRLRTRRLLSLFDAYLSPGQRVREYLEALGVDPWQIVDTPHAVDNERFAATARPFQTPEGRRAARSKWGLPQDATVALFAGKLEEKKRPLDLIRAASQMTPRPAVLVVGAGELESACREEAARLDVQVAFAGFLNQSEMGEAYAAADVLVLPSDARETWGMVVNEALATGLPVVVSDSAGCAPDLADEDTGARFACGDVAGLARAMGEVRDRARVRSYADRCRARAATFDIASATAGLVRACQLVARVPETAPRVVACCGNMVTVTGLERMTFTVLDGLRRNGARLHCVVNSWENHRIVPLIEGVGGTWSLGGHTGTITRRRLTPWRVTAMLYDISIASAALLRAARRMRATHVLLPDHLAPIRNVFALVWLRLRGVHVIMHLNNAPDQGTFYRWYWSWVISPLTDQMVCNSEFTQRELLALGVPVHKTLRIYNTLPPRTAPAAAVEAPAPVAGRILYVGQVIPGKGLDLLVDALALLRARGIDASLLVAGDIDGWTVPAYWPFRQALRARTSRPNLAAHVEFLGWRDDVDRLMRTASVHCAPSLPDLREGFGLVNLEAKDAGVPSVVFASGAYPEVVTHGVDGWVSEVVSAEGLAEGLEYFLANADRRQQAGVAARRSLARFDRDVFDLAWKSVFFGAAPRAPILPIGHDTIHAGPRTGSGGHAAPAFGRIRVTAVLDRPEAGYAQWFRHIAAHESGLMLSVLYANESPSDGGVQRADPLLREGYRSQVVDRLPFTSSGYAIGRAIREARPDVVFVPHGDANGMAPAVLAARRAAVPLIFGGDGDHVLTTEGVGGQARVRRRLARFDACLSPSPRMRLELESLDVDPWQIVDAPALPPRFDGLEAATASLVQACGLVARVPREAPRVVACCGNMVTVTGLERMTFTVLRGLRQRGARVHCIVNSWENHRIVALAEGVGASWSLGGHQGTISRHNLSPLGIARMISDIHVSSSALWRAASRLRATHVLIPDHLAPVRNVFALARLRAHGVRVIMRLGNAPDQSAFYRLYWRWMIAPLTDYLVCNSEFTRRELLALGVPARKTSRIYNALSVRERVPAGPRVTIPGRILYVGQIIPGKGLDLLLDAVALVRTRGVDASLAVAGDIEGWTVPAYRPFRAAIRARALQSDLAGHVEFLGWRDDVPQVMETADVHCAPSRLELREGFGLVNLEAKQAGVPSVVFPSGAYPEVLTHKVDGWVSQEVTAEGLAEGLHYFLTNPERRAAAAAAARQSLSRFDPGVFDEAWWATFADATPRSESIAGIEGRVTSHEVTP